MEQITDRLASKGVAGGGKDMLHLLECYSLFLLMTTQKVLSVFPLKDK